jgi:hypothetical protein
MRLLLFLNHAYRFECFAADERVCCGKAFSFTIDIGFHFGQLKPQVLEFAYGLAKCGASVLLFVI